MAWCPRLLLQPMSHRRNRGYRHPVEIISHAVWLYFRFHLSFREVEELLAERGVSAHDAPLQIA